MTTTPEQDERLRAFGELAGFLRAINEPFDKIWLGFWDYHQQHPDVAPKLHGLAIQARKRGLARYSITMLWEVLRWHLVIVDGRTEEFKCPNAYRSRYARYLMWSYPELQGFFVLSALRAMKEAA